MARKNYKTPAQYKLTDLEHDEEQPYEIDLAPLLRQSAKQNSQSRVNRLLYKAHVVKGHGSLKRGDRDTDVYRDATYTMILSTTIAKIKWLRWLPRVLMPSKYVCNLALACIGFEINQKDILVKQIQGVQGMKNELKRIHWEKFLLKLVEDWAHANGFEKISVLKAEKNHWWHVNNSDAKKQRFKMHYDVTAKRSGFKFCPEEECYVKRLIATA